LLIAELLFIFHSVGQIFGLPSEEMFG